MPNVLDFMSGFFLFVFFFFFLHPLSLSLCKITCSKPQSFNLAFAFYALSLLSPLTPSMRGVHNKGAHTHTQRQARFS